MSDEAPIPPTEVEVIPPSPIQKKAAALKQQAAEAQIMQQLGAKVMRIKAKTLKSLGDTIQVCGIRSIGHGRFVVAAEQAEQAFVKCGELIEKLTAGNKEGLDPKVLDLLQLQSTFNSQIIAIAKEELDSDRQPDAGKKGGAYPLPFPPGKNMAILIESNNGSSS